MHANIMNTTAKHIASFLFSISAEVWIWILGVGLLQGMGWTTYTPDELFWFFVIITVAPILSTIVIYTPQQIWKRDWKFFLSVIVFTFLIFLLTQFEAATAFIPALPLLEVIVLFVYSFISVWLGYMVSGDKTGNAEAVVASMIKLLSLITGIVFAIFLFDPDTLMDVALWAIIFAVPVSVILSGTLVSTRIKKSKDHAKMSHLW